MTKFTYYDTTRCEIYRNDLDKINDIVDIIYITTSYHYYFANEMRNIIIMPARYLMI